MKPFFLNLLALAVIATSLFFTALFTIAEGVSYLANVARPMFSKVTAYALKPLVAVAGLTSALTVMAAETQATEGISAGMQFFTLLYDSWAMLPIYMQIIGALWLFVPVFSFIVSATDTPADDKLWGKWIYPVIEKLAFMAFKSKQLPANDLLEQYKTHRR